MKKHLFMWQLLLFVAIIAVSCTKQDEALSEKGKIGTLTIVATQGDNVQTRISYGQESENLHLVWTDGDKIMVKENTSDDSEVLEFTLTDGAGSPRGTFTYEGVIPSSWPDETELIAYYKPDNDNILLSPWETIINFPTNSTQTANNDMSHLIAYNHMKSEPFNYNANVLTELKFNQLGAIMKLELSGLEGKCIKSLKLVADDYIFVGSDEGWHTTKQNSITLNLGENNAGITLVDAEKLTAYLMLGVHADANPNGKNIKLYAFDDEEVVYEANITGGTLEAGKLYSLSKTMSEKVYWQGEGTAASPYRISSVNDLHTLKEWTSYLGKGTNGLHFQLQNDIDMEDTWLSYIDEFSGVFDGNGKTISNLKYNAGNGNNALFSHLNSGGVIKNLTISGTIIENEYSNAGGIVGMNEGIVIGCTNLVDIKGRHYAAGIVRTNNYGKVIACVNKGDLECSEGIVGGIVEQQVSSSGEIIACYNVGTINGTTTQDARVGGILSEGFDGKVIACYNTGTLQGNPRGNIVGRVLSSVLSSASSFEINNCYYYEGSDNAVGQDDNNRTSISGGGAVSGTDWTAAMSAMNSALESEGVGYRYELNTDEATKTTEPLKLKLIQVEGSGNGNLGDYGNNGSI